jgi:2-phospho-L-lactate guanylyltransferase
MKVGALVPVKAFAHGKQRLRARLSDAAVDALERAMLSDVLTTLAQSGVTAVYAVTGDAEVAHVAAEAGASVRMLTPDPGLNAAIDAADLELARYGYDASLVVLGDLPLLGARDVDHVLSLGRRYDVVVVPACDGGTAMLLRCPPQCMPARFGRDSAAAHATCARARGRTLHVDTAIDEAVRGDVDTPEDARRVLAYGGACRTREVLRSLEW